MKIALYERNEKLGSVQVIDGELKIDGPERQAILFLFDSMRNAPEYINLSDEQLLETVPSRLTGMIHAHIEKEE